MIISLIVNFVPIIIAIVLHELAHGYAAYLLGDNTAKKYNRLSLNPIKHADIFGTIILPAILLTAKTGFIFGWAKPVPVNYNNLRHPQRDVVIVASAGIIMNFLLALLSFSLLKICPIIESEYIREMLTLFLVNMIAYNIVIAVFNALPIPPLDGSKILFGWSTSPQIQKFLNAERAGLAVIVTIAFIIPIITNHFGYHFNPLGYYLIKTTKFFLSFLI